MPTIVPALLTDDKQKLQTMLEQCKQFTGHAQVDIMDGKFVPSTSISVQDLQQIKADISTEAHVMVQDPLAWSQAFKQLGTKRFIFHFEIDQDIAATITALRKDFSQVGIAVNPDTQISDFQEFLPLVDVVLFLAVNPGFYGAPFIPQILDKIKNFKQQFPKIIAGIDGGVKQENLIEIANSGVDYICVGSGIMKTPNPAQAYHQFQEMLQMNH